MKIINNEQVLKVHYAEPNNKTKSPVVKEFSKILKESVENTKKTDAKLQSPTPINPFSGVKPLTSPPLDKQFTIERIEDLIDLLEQYRHKLADPQIALGKIAPLIKEMDRAKESLNPYLDSLQDGEELKAILNQTLVTTSLEIAKYRRGDYVTV